MARLRHQDVAAFARAMEQLHAAADMPSLAGRATRCLHALFDCDLVSFDLLDATAQRWNTLVVSPALENWDALLAALHAHAHEHPIVTHAARFDYPHAIRFSDLLSQRQYRQTGLYQDFFKPHVMGLDRQLGFVDKPSETLTFGVSLNRRGRDFSVEQRALLELLRPHLLQAYHTARAHALLLEHQAAERESTARVAGGGTCEIDHQGKIQWATAAVAPLLTRYFPAARPADKRLPAALREALQPALGPGRSADDSLRHTRRSWTFPRAHGVLRVHLTAGSMVEDRWLLLLAEAEPDASAPELAARHGLTTRESETLYWLGQGKSNEDIALLMGIAPRTVGKNVERLFGKLGVFNRTAAARVALGK